MSGLLEQCRQEAMKNEGQRIKSGNRPRSPEQIEEIILEIYHDALWEQNKQKAMDGFYTEAMSC